MNAVNPLTCKSCLETEVYGAYKQPGTSQCKLCEQWVKYPSLMERIVRFFRGH